MEFLTVKETAQLLRVSPITVRRYIASGQLAAERVGRGIRVRREAIEKFVTPVACSAETEGPTDWSRKPSGYADEDLAEIWSPSTPGGVAWVPIDRLDEYADEKIGSNEHPLRNIIGIGRSGVPTNIAEYKDEYVADAILALNRDEDDFDPDELLGKPTTEDDPLWSIIGVATSDEPNDVASNKHKYLADAILADKSMG